MARCLAGNCRRFPARSSARCPARPIGAVPGTKGAAAPAEPLAAQGPELVFAAVRPGFVAACMVEAAGDEDGARHRVSRPGRPLARPWPTAGAGRPGPFAAIARAVGRRVAAQ